MSSAARVAEILAALDLSASFDFIASGDDVERGKPDPEIYTLVATHFGFEGHECLVIEDSPDGVKAGLDAGMHVVAVTTPFSRKRVLESGYLPRDRVADGSRNLMRAVRRIIDAESDAGVEERVRQ
jgi:beta-phosphoglucomutase-like phosphatase (HAD superfamily)